LAGRGLAPKSLKPLQWH